MGILQPKNIYFLACLLAVLCLSSIRSFPVYGKLDFIVLDDAPWWKPWRPMINRVLADGEQPILSDVITSTVLRAVFAQKSVLFIHMHDPRCRQIDLQKLVKINQSHLHFMSPGALLLLFHDSGISPEYGENSAKRKRKQRVSLRQILAEAATKIAAQRKKIKTENDPYRCIINLHPFPASWVPEETGHWSGEWASHPSLYYAFRGKHGNDMIRLLKGNPPGNCFVYF